MSDIEVYIEDLQLLYEESKDIPLTRKISVDKEELNRIIIEIQGTIPAEIKKAKKIVDQCDEYIEDAKKSSETIIKHAEIEAERLISEHEVYLGAVEEATQIREKAEDTANNGVLEAMKFVDDLLARTEDTIFDSREKINAEFRKIDETLANTLDLLYEAREDLRNG